ncbi:transporter substrate-binding domain-containing protein [Microvirga sp. VF16]|uniref:transporter substrate-binding domain-containing protein n=1 Tax=Microvirga sp. VF16 TaxID=2807101 RepID=UPI00193D5AF6|nr:transporter substrate-binding domain-containing protein [Microvirga sp. VF16]QRM32892.1 transporter substrate-binding domain-containing protein [Microvirga sp. VF16]
MKGTTIMKASNCSLLLSTAALVAALAQPAHAQPQQKVVIGFDGSYPPFASVGADGELKGFDVDIVKGVCSAEKLRCELRNMPWDGIFTALDTRKIDVIATVAITDERKKRAAFSRPYLKSPWAYMTLASSSINGSGDALTGKVIGTVAASSLERFLNGKMGSKVKVSTYDSMDAAVLDLDSGRVDAILGEATQIQPAYIQAKPGTYKIVGEPFTDPTYTGQGQGLAVRLDDKALVKAIDSGIEALIKNGSHAEFTKKWFGVEMPPQ